MNDYLEKLKDPRWQKKRLEIFERDGWRCKMCGDEQNTLHVHHLFYFKDVEPWDVHDGFLISLCEFCHGLTKGKNLAEDEETLDLRSDVGGLLGGIWAAGYDLPDLLEIGYGVYCSKKKKRQKEICMGFEVRPIYKQLKIKNAKNKIS